MRRLAPGAGREFRVSLRRAPPPSKKRNPPARTLPGPLYRMQTAVRTRRRPRPGERGLRWGSELELDAAKLCGGESFSEESRMARGGRRTALAAGGIGFLVVIGAGFALRGKLLEEWWLFRLGSNDPAVREEAAAGLSALGSRRAIPRLCEMARDGAPGRPLIAVRA